MKGCFLGVADDFRRRYPHYCHDLRNGFQWKTLSSALFMFFATFTSTVSLGVKISKDTNNRIGVPEYVMMNSIAGMAHALFGCQPMLVLRPTGPITAIITKLSQIADALYLDFWQFLAWTGFFISFFMIVVAAFEISRFIKLLTRFTHEIFAFFVCSIYIYDGASSVIKRFNVANDMDIAALEHECKDGNTVMMASFSRSLFAAIIAIGTLGISLFLHSARRWSSFCRCFRVFLADYAVTVAIICMSLFSIAFPNEHGLVDYIEVPPSFEPTCRIKYNGTNGVPVINAGTPLCESGDASTGNISAILAANVWWRVSSSNSSSLGAPRPWLARLWDDGTPALLPLYAALCALVIVLFFYMDQNISSLLTQLKSRKLERGSYYHSSFFLLGIFNAIGPLFGLPFVTGSLPHSPQFVKAVTNYDEFIVEEEVVSKHPSKKHSSTDSAAIENAADTSESSKRVNIRKLHRISAVFENRVAPFLMYFLIGLTLLVPQIIEVIPEGCVDGLLMFVGIAGLFDCELWYRLQLLYHLPSDYPRNAKYTNVPPCRMHSWTFLQIVCLAAAWAVFINPTFGLAVSFVIIALIPFRIYLVPKCFGKDELESLDSENKEDPLSD